MATHRPNDAGTVLEVLDADLVDEVDLSLAPGEAASFEDESTQIYQAEQHGAGGFEEEATRVFQADDPHESDTFEDEATRVWQGSDPAPAPRGAAAPAATAKGAPNRGAASKPAAAVARGASAPKPAASSTQGVSDLRGSSASLSRRATEATVITEPSAPPARAARPARPTGQPAAVVAQRSSPLIPILATLLAVAAVAILVLMLRPRGVEPVETGHIAVFTVPSGASVAVNGVAVPNRTPTTLSGLEVGAAHTLTLSLDGYQPVSEVVVLTSAEPTQRQYQLEAAGASIVVRTTPDGAKITLNGVPRGVSPVSIGDLDPQQTYQLVAELDGYAPAERSVRWAAEAPREQLVALALTAAAPPPPEPVVPEAPAAEPVAAAPAPPRSSASASARPSRTVPERPSARATAPQAAAPRATAPRPSGSPPAAPAAAPRERPSQRTAPAPAPAAAAAEGFGSVSVQAVPFGQVWINGRMVSPETPLINHRLAVGVYSVKVYYTSLRAFSEERTVRVDADQNRTLTFRSAQ